MPTWLELVSPTFSSLDVTNSTATVSEPLAEAAVRTNSTPSPLPEMEKENSVERVVVASTKTRGSGTRRRPEEEREGLVRRTWGAASLLVTTWASPKRSMLSGSRLGDCVEEKDGWTRRIKEQKMKRENATMPLRFFDGTMILSLFSSLPSIFILQRMFLFLVSTAQNCCFFAANVSTAHSTLSFLRFIL
ncbi:hypothetical protein V8G54_020348 [Vigna mungo]|uniref:Uncharacterized protein n=1 Tax=Vigna mungo TaxID=3915 RepID=A0AAQ3NC48_VIGMU